MPTPVPTDEMATLPTAEETEPLGHALYKAVQDIEDIRTRMGRFLDAYRDRNEVIVVPTLEDVGRMYDFTNMLTTQSHFLSEQIASLEIQLDGMNLMRLDLSVRQARRHA